MMIQGRLLALLVAVSVVSAFQPQNVGSCVQRSTLPALQASNAVEEKPSFVGTEEDDSDIDVEEKKATKAFENEDRVGFLKSVARFSFFARSARKELKEERVLRQEAESNLRTVAEEARDMEDSFELGQNELSRTSLELGFAKDKLAASQRDLYITAKNLEGLQDERQSFRKMGKAAFKLSKERVGRKISQIIGKED